MPFKIKKINKYEIVYLTFAFDSLLKIDILGVRVHVGVAAILILLILAVLSGSILNRIRGFLAKNWSILPFCFYVLFQLALNNIYPGTLMLLLYLVLGLSVFFFAFCSDRFISIRAIIYFQWILIISGLVQFCLFKIFGYQLSFLDAAYYDYEGSFATRLRGFFVEPNWYSIIITFNTLLLTMDLKKKAYDYHWLILFTLCCLLFNGSYTFVGVIALVVLFETVVGLTRVSRTRLVILAFMLVTILGLVTYRSESKPESVGYFAGRSMVVNYASRLLPLYRTIDYMFQQTSYRQIFGYGLGSWPYVGLEENQLGFIGIQGEYKIEPGKRDSAEIQVFILELGYLGLFLILFDFIYNYLRYRTINTIYTISCACIAASFFVYPVLKFAIYLLPFYLIRAKAVKGWRKNVNRIY